MTEKGTETHSDSLTPPVPACLRILIQMYREILMFDAVSYFLYRIAAVFAPSLSMHMKAMLFQLLVLIRPTLPIAD